MDEITFYLKSGYNFVQRSVNAYAPRYPFDVRDGNATHLFAFLTQVVSGRLVFTYMAGGSGTYYVPVGREDALFGCSVWQWSGFAGECKLEQRREPLSERYAG